MKIFCGENISIIWLFYEDDEITPIQDLTIYDISIIVRHKFKAVITASTLVNTDCYKISNISDNKMMFELTKEMTSLLGGECSIELKLSRGNSVLITESSPFFVNSSIIGRNTKI